MVPAGGTILFFPFFSFLCIKCSISTFLPFPKIFLFLSPPPQHCGKGFEPPD